MTGKSVRSERVDATREAILHTAERLCAEYGVYAVSNRQISEAAGQGNNAAVGYHFGTKTDLVRAIIRKHADQIEHIRQRMLAHIGDSDEVRDWVGCLVRPSTEHLAELGHPTWFARFAAQVMTDPALRELMISETLVTPGTQATLDGLNRCIPSLPIPVHLERHHMASALMVHMCAERERALAEGADTPRSCWRDAGTGLVDAITGIWLAPVTRPTSDSHERPNI